MQNVLQEKRGAGSNQEGRGWLEVAPAACEEEYTDTATEASMKHLAASSVGAECGAWDGGGRGCEDGRRF